MPSVILNDCAEYHIMLNGIMLNGIMLNGIMLIVDIPNVVAPSNDLNIFRHKVNSREKEKEKKRERKRKRKADTE